MIMLFFVELLMAERQDIFLFLFLLYFGVIFFIFFLELVHRYFILRTS